jgi:hypothetical protein
VEVFKPERWLDADEERLGRMNRTLFQFGMGAHLCIGKNISLLEITKFVTRLVTAYEVRNISFIFLLWMTERANEIQCADHSRTSGRGVEG